MTELDTNISTAFGSPPPPEPVPEWEDAEIVVTAPRYVPAALRISIVLGTAIALASGVAACVADTTADPKVPTLSVGELALILQEEPLRYAGRTVRTCGNLTNIVEKIQTPTSDLWEMSQPNDPYPHGSFVRVIANRGCLPRSYQDGCLTGQIALQDGTTDLRNLPKFAVSSDQIGNSIWFLHPVCRPRA